MRNKPEITVYGRLVVEVHSDRQQMGRVAARRVAAIIRGAIDERGGARVVFACAPSQNEFLTELCSGPQEFMDIEWSKVTVFHMDEYVGLPAGRPQSFRQYLLRHLLSRVKAGRFFPIEAQRSDLIAVCREYSEALAEKPIDLICLGIGENGHIAFNDPPVADFDDPELVKIVELEAACRSQQVHDGCFDQMEDVPSHAVTITIPVFRMARYLSIHVPGPQKATAVHNALTGAITPECPASILRTHPNATMHLDENSAALLHRGPAGQGRRGR